MSPFDTLIALCGPAALERGLVLLPALLAAGLAGGVVHCTAMCGPFVLGQAADGMARLPGPRMCEANRLRAGLLLPYHAGRLLTYGGLGVAAGALGGLWLPAAVPAGLLMLAALAFLLMAAGRLRPPLRLGWPAGGPPLARALRGLPLGLALGFLPCGMVYAALAAAAAAGPVMGGAAMLAFGLGTVPALAVVGVLGHAAARRWQGATRRAAPWVLAANAVVLAVLAVRTLAA